MLKDFLFFLKRKLLSYFREQNPPKNFSSENKKIHHKKISYNLISKKFLYFLKRKLFLYFREQKLWKDFSSIKKTKRQNKIHHEKISFTLILKNFLNFLKGKFFLYFKTRNPRKNSLYFRKRNFLTFQEKKLSEL